MRWDPGNRRSKHHRATVWLFTMGSSHPIFFSVSVESLAMNFCSQTVGLRPGQGEGFALPVPPGREQSAKSLWSGCGVGGGRGQDGGRQASVLRGGGLSIRWQLREDDKAGLGELTFSSSLTGKRAHSSVLGRAHGRSLLKGTTNGRRGRN